MSEDRGTASPKPAASASVADLRREYEKGGLRRADLLPDPVDQFHRWFAEARAQETEREPNAMILATADRQGVPSARTVLLKGAEQRGFSFYTNFQSRKGHELGENPQAALVFYWPSLERQVCVAGPVTRLPEEEADAYFRSRPRGSQLSAWITPESEPVPHRSFLEERLATLERQFEGREVSRPPYWGGFCVQPARIEFWQGRPNRVHDRFQYTRTEAGDWKVERMAP